MKITYDPESKAMYIYLTDIGLFSGVVDHPQEITDEVTVDWKDDGTLYGIEILCVDRKPIIIEEK